MNTEIKSFFAECLEEYTNLNQNDLINESSIIRFAKDRGIRLSKGIKSDPSKFVELGWITTDSTNGFFHPFRIYPFLRAIKLCNLNITASSSLNRDSFQNFLNGAIGFLPSLKVIESEVKLADQVSNLAILLEPLFWPKITSKTTLSSPNCLSLGEFEVQLKPYNDKVLEFIKGLDPEIWQSYHERLRIEAARLDDNHELYILLRLSPWVKRKNIKGNIGGALWLRHIAEVIRLAFEEVHGVQWSEEDEAFGIWREGAKTKLYGSERPIQNALTTRPHIAFEFGLHTGSPVRWYVEGDTEYQAASYVLPKAALAGIEFINLKGVFKENANAPMRFEDHLKNDRELKRFSFISFDADRMDNVKLLKKHIEQNNIVGYVNLNQPDFEFENFSVDELIEIAIQLDGTLGFDSKSLLSGNKQDINSGRTFEKYYIEHSARKISLKGKEWGEALAKYAFENPLKADTGLKRTFIETIDQVLLARRVSYDYQRDYFEIDPNNFQIKEKDKPSL